LAEVARAALVTALLIGHFGPRGDLWAFLLPHPAHFGIRRNFPRPLSADGGPLDPEDRSVIYVVSYILYPVVWFMSKSTAVVLRALGQEGEVRPFVTREELQLLLQTETGPTDMSLTRKP